MAKADAAISPPMKPPPGSLWPRRSTKMENSTIRLVRYGATVRKITVRMSCLLPDSVFHALAPTDAQERQDGEAGDHDDGDLAQRIEAAEIDDDDVDDVAAVRDHARIGA